jgi:hypothetical protein
MQIGHEEARKLIQFSLEQTLETHEKSKLQTHLDTCESCRAYAEDLAEVESVLIPLMERQWNFQPTPLSIRSISEKRISKLDNSMILATRTAMISIIFVAFIFSIWQFTQSGKQTSDKMPVGVPPVPTPSMHSTSTKIVFRNCEEITYQVRENDTLEKIAHQFSVSKQEIMSINNLKTETLNPVMELLIPSCHSTPTGTMNPTIFTRTYTPSMDTIASTPGG